MGYSLAEGYRDWEKEVLLALLGVRYSRDRRRGVQDEVILSSFMR